MPAASPLSSRGYQIGEAARLSGVTAANIRFYEKQGLLSPQGRGENSYRFYSEGDVHQLRFIRLCRAMDMSLDEVRTLLALDLNNKRDCATAREALDDHLGHVRARLAELKALEKDLKALRNRCDGGDTHCHIIEALHELADAPQGSAPLAGTARKRHV
jgi:DNA-binding transcriptional MerR regulator